MSQFVTDRAYDYFDLGDESDQESAESSEDEIDIILHGTAEQRRRLRQTHEKEQRQKMVKPSKHPKSKSEPQEPRDADQSSSEDEFEKEMNAELDYTVHMLEETRGANHTSGTVSASSQPLQGEGSKQGSSKAGKDENPFYDDIYFDSDDEENYEGEGEARTQRHHARPSNDDLLYDPDMDDEDQKWVEQQRKRQHGISNQTSRSQKGKKRKKQATPKSDAVLDCPACMTTLCLDCQRHDIYPNQYRAMFVMNCKVNTSEQLSVPEQTAKKKFKKGKNSGQGQGDSTDSQSSASRDAFHPVLCEECDTVVGVIDVEEVYHFFNVLASLS